MIPRYTRPEMGKLWSDESRLQAMLDVELAVLDAQSKIGLVPRRAVTAISKKARINVKRVEQIEAKTRHDVIAFIEQLEECVGKDGRYLHMGLTSSDVLDTSLAVLLKKATQLLLKDLTLLEGALASKARRHKNTLMIGRTHGVHAEPTTFGLKLAVFYDEFRRHKARLKQSLDEISVGKISGAVGTFASLDPSIEKSVCQKLGLKVAPISTQIIQRERHAAYLTTLALIGTSLEKLSTEIRHLQRTEVQEVEEPFGSGQKGSSAMPHKKNPVSCEQITGLSRLLRSYSLAAMENVTLWHERDISHSSVERVIFPDSTILLDHMLSNMTRVISGLVVYPEKMKENLEKTNGVVYSGQVLLALMRKGLTRTQAYELVQRCALSAWKEKEAFTEVLLHDKAISKYLTLTELKRCINPSSHTKHVGKIFKRVGL